jgi:hypothetical protein
VQLENVRCWLLLYTPDEEGKRPIIKLAVETVLVGENLLGLGLELEFGFRCWFGGFLNAGGLRLECLGFLVCIRMIVMFLGVC